MAIITISIFAIVRKVCEIKLLQEKYNHDLAIVKSAIGLTDPVLQGSLSYKVTKLFEYLENIKKGV